MKKNKLIRQIAIKLPIKIGEICPGSNRISEDPGRPCIRNYMASIKRELILWHAARKAKFQPDYCGKTGLALQDQVEKCKSQGKRAQTKRSRRWRQVGGQRVANSRRRDPKPIRNQEPQQAGATESDLHWGTLRRQQQTTLAKPNLDRSMHLQNISQLLLIKKI